MNKKPRSRRSPRPLRFFDQLETRRLLSVSSVDYWPNVLTGDSSPTAATPVVGSSSSYTLRELVQYYNQSYNQPDPFQIVLSPSTTYTLTESTDSASIWGGRLNNLNQYGALDVSPVYSTAGPLEIVGTTNAEITCSIVGSGAEQAPLDRLFHVLSGSLKIQNTELFRGLALDDGTGSKGTDSEGGGVLVNPGATLSVTSCMFKSNAASGTATSDRDGGHNAAGGGIYAAAGSSLNITGLTSFVNSRLIAGHGASAVGTGAAGGSAFGAGVAMSAPVSGESNTTNSSGTLTFTANGTGAAQFTAGRINSEVLGTGHILTVGGTGGTGSQTGGAGGNAYGGGLYIGAGTVATPQQPALNLSGTTAISFSDNQSIGGKASTNGNPPHQGLGGSAFGAGAYIEPASASVTNGPTSDGIMTFTNNTETSYLGGYSGNPLADTTTTNGLSLPTVNPSTAATAATTVWSLPRAVAVVNTLAATGMAISLNMGPQAANPGFETPSLATGSFEYYGGQTQGSWSFSGNSGISSNASGFTGGNPAAPQGTQVALLQDTGAITQTIGGFATGASYSISFEAAQRSGYPQSSVNITVDGTSIGTFVPSGTTYQIITTPAFTASSAFQTIEFTGVDPGGNDQTVFIDNIQIIATTIASYPGNITISSTGSGSVDILGAGESSTLITGANSTGVFILEAGAHVALHYLTVEDGSASNGAGIDASGAAATLSNDSVVSNASTSNGAGIYQNGGTLSINNSALTRNTASGNGGGLFVQNANVTMEQVTITDETASQNGGGIYQSGGTLVISNDGRINHNSGDWGAGIYLSSCVFSMSGGQLEDDTSSGIGGAVYVSGTSSTPFTLSTVTVSGNVTTDGGGAGAGIQATNVPLLLTDCTFSGNNSAGNGGAIFANGSSVLNVSGGTITDNNALNGGGIFVQQWSSGVPSATISGATISDNNASQNGGGIYGATVAAFSVVSAVVKTNTASTSSGYGGGIYLSAGSIVVKASTITANQASQGGGGYFVGGNATVKNGSVVKNNSAGVNGGGLLSWDNNLNISNAAISSNKVTVNSAISGYGGGIYQNNGGSLSVTNQTSVKNNSASAGGGILCNLSHFLLESSQIKSNTATIAGAGFFSLTNSQTMSITHGTISGNVINATGGAEGAGLYLSGSGALNTDGLVVTNNTINQPTNNVSEGAGIYASGSPITFNGAASSTPVSLSSDYNRMAIVTDGTSFSGGGADGDGTAFSSNLLGSTLTGLGAFNLGPANQNDAVLAGGQTISVPAGSFTAINLAAAGVNGAQTGQEMILHFTDNSSESIFQSFSDWCVASEFTNESVLSSMDYRDTSSGGQNVNTPHVYGYSFPIPSGKTVSSITLPNDNNLDILAINLSTNSASTTITGNTLNNSGGGDAFGGGIYAGSNVSVTVQAPLVLTNNSVVSSSTGVGGGIAFESGTSYTANYLVTCTGNTASDGGDAYAFVLTNQNGESYTGSEDGPSGIHYFTSGEGSLYSAVQYCENWMNGNANNSSTAIMLSTDDSSANYLLDLYGTSNHSSIPLTTSIASGNTLTLIGTNGQAGIQGWFAETLYVENSGSLVLQNLLITGGDSPGNGGGIYQASGTITLNNVSVYGNLAGSPQTTASPNYSSNQRAGTGQVGASGGSGSTYAGGGIYLSGGTLNLLSNDSVSNNAVYGQNGGAGEGGGGGQYYGTSWGGTKVEQEPQNGGNGGNGGNALGGGIYEAGGTLNGPAGGLGSIVQGNTAHGGSGGKGGSAGPTGPNSYNPSNGSSGSPGASVPSYSHAGGNTVFSSSATSGALAITSGMYASSGTINASSLSTDLEQAAAAGSLSRLANIEVSLYAANGSLIATTYSDANGVFRFDTSFSGMGYIQVNPSPIFQFSPEGAVNTTSNVFAVSSSSGRSSIVQFLDGVAVNRLLDVLLQKIPAKLELNGNAIAKSAKNSTRVLWTAHLMPATYTGGFAMTAFDVNGDRTPDYVLATKKGPTKFFIVDGRTGEITRIRGSIDPAFRHPFSVQAGQFIKGGGTQLLVNESNSDTGAVMLIDVNKRRVVWSVRRTLPGASYYRSVAALESGRSGLSDVGLYNKSAPFHFMVLNGRDGHTVRSGTGFVSYAPPNSRDRAIPHTT